MQAPRRLALFLVFGLAGGLGLAWALHRSTSPTDPDDRPSGSPWFEDVTEQSGLHFVHDAGPTGTFFMPQVLGSGAALFDCDGDRKLDIYLLHNGGPKGKRNQLFRQEEGGRFRDISAGSGLDVAGDGMGGA